MNEPEIILGFVGKLGAGKGTAIDYLVEKHGFYSSSCSDRIREEIVRQGLEITRERLQEIGGKLREELGPAVLAIKTWEMLLSKEIEKAAIDSIRGLPEVEYLKTLPNFYLIAIEADPKIRFERITKRQRESDPQTWEDFFRAEERDLNKDGRNIDACIAAADFHIGNEGTTDELYKKVEEVLDKIFAKNES